MGGQTSDHGCDQQTIIIIGKENTMSFKRTFDGSTKFECQETNIELIDQIGSDADQGLLDKMMGRNQRGNVSEPQILSDDAGDSCGEVLS